MRFILIVSALFGLNSLAMELEQPGVPIFSVPLGNYIPANIGDDSDEESKVDEAPTAGDDAETSRYQPIAPLDESSEDQEEFDDIDMDLIRDLFNI